MKRLCVVVLILIAVTIPSQRWVSAAPPREAAADTLAAQGKLFCHRTMRATGWFNTGSAGGGGWRESDQDTSDNTLCGYNENGGWDVYSTGGTPVVGTGPTGLPVYQLTGETGAILFVEARPGSTPNAQSNLTGRIGWRYYHWMSDNARCESSKHMTVGLYWSFLGAPEIQTNAAFGWQGGGETVPGLNSSMLRNKWWRMEGYQNTWTNFQSQTVILKNITDNGPEFTQTVTSGGSLFEDFKTGFTHFIHLHRDDRSAPGSCTQRFAYLLVGKNLGTNERIPPSAEMETVIPSPAAPSNLQVTTP